ncbi:putative F-box protein [Acorus gramineus]|uniref:F-box protein n=1 Tax=Acorus gramineus TaxID=55184 RepID=A0AAV9BT49_ACOGR|nr:putative F-box protein [Acorus gramineus]
MERNTVRMVEKLQTYRSKRAIDGVSLRLEKGKTSKTENRNNNNGEHEVQWSELPDPALDVISKKLSIVELFSFGGVCNRWRSVYSTAKVDSMAATQLPLLVHSFSLPRRTLRLYNTDSGISFMKRLPLLHGRKFCGTTGSYLILMNKSYTQPLLVNPFTGHKILFPKCYWLLFPRLCLLSTPSGLFLVEMGHWRHIIKYCQSGGTSWFIHVENVYRFGFMDAVVFKGKIYVVSSTGRFATLDLVPEYKLTIIETTDEDCIDPGNLDYLPYLVESGGELLVLHLFFDPGEVGLICFEIYRFDFERSKWIEVQSLGGRALFVTYGGSAVSVDPTPWGGQGDCLYIAGPMMDYWSLLTLDGKTIFNFPVPPRDQDFSRTNSTHVWIHPSL